MRFATTRESCYLTRSLGFTPHYPVVPPFAALFSISPSVFVARPTRLFIPFLRFFFAWLPLFSAASGSTVGDTVVPFALSLTLSEKEIGTREKRMEQTAELDAFSASFSVTQGLWCGNMIRIMECCRHVSLKGDDIEPEHKRQSKYGQFHHVPTHVKPQGNSIRPHL